MKRSPEHGERVFVFGAGSVGRGLTRALRGAGVRATVRAARAGLPRKIDAELVVLAVRDGELASLARRMATAGTIGEGSAVVHVAGALGPGVLAPLRGVCAGVGQMHPLAAFAAVSTTPDLAGVSVYIRGDRTAVERARRAARAMGMKPWTHANLDAERYHAAAGLVAGGTVALAAIATELLVASGVARERTRGMVGRLIRSVGDNVDTLGLPHALTGPLRRGDVATVEGHIRAIRATVPEGFPLCLASTRAQLALARQIADASPEALGIIERMLQAYSINPRQTGIEHDLDLDCTQADHSQRERLAAHRKRERRL
jgi:predicted short-subunit dehydrogenase-like oxidoreductase (DUF2520 family)